MSGKNKYFYNLFLPAIAYNICYKGPPKPKILLGKNHWLRMAAVNLQKINDMYMGKFNKQFS